jgi:hypothetical protein
VCVVDVSSKRPCFHTTSLFVGEVEEDGWCIIISYLPSDTETLHYSRRDVCQIHCSSFRGLHFEFRTDYKGGTHSLFMFMSVG